MKQKKKANIFMVKQAGDSEPEPAMWQEKCNCRSSPIKLREAGEISQSEIYIAEEIITSINSIVRQLLVEVRLASVLCIHISQLGSIVPTLEEKRAPKSIMRQRFHAPPELFEQVFINVRRALRATDKIIEQGDKGAFVLLPDVDAEAAHRIVERIYRSISLLQAGTIEPPLSLETNIQVGSRTYTTEDIAYGKYAEFSIDMAYNLNLRPVITFPIESIESEENEKAISYDSRVAEKDKVIESIPFMDLPERVAVSLGQMLPHAIARKMRCAPVGRSGQRLTVAMVEPTNSESIELLQKLTGMAIFPVACNEENLNNLLKTGW